jgi:hypothetical protein
MSDAPMNAEEMAEEARRWAEGELPPGGLVDAPEAVPRAKESMQINIRLPCQMVAILKEIARRSGIGYQVLMKRWLDERLRQERERLRQEQERLRRERERAQRPPIIKLASPSFVSQAAAFDASVVSDLATGATSEECAASKMPVK